MDEWLIAWLAAGGIVFPILIILQWIVERKDKRN